MSRPSRKKRKRKTDPPSNPKPIGSQAPESRSTVKGASSTSRRNKAPPGFVQCEVCGEYNGSTSAKNLNWHSSDPPRGKISVTCLCHGIPCKYCGTMMHRPISNEYDLVGNQIWHNPYFTGWLGCDKCEAKRRGHGTGCARRKSSGRCRAPNRGLKARVVEVT